MYHQLVFIHSLNNSNLPFIILKSNIMKLRMITSRTSILSPTSKFFQSLDPEFPSFNGSALLLKCSLLLELSTLNGKKTKIIHTFKEHLSAMFHRNAFQPWIHRHLWRWNLPVSFRDHLFELLKLYIVWSKYFVSIGFHLIWTKVVHLWLRCNWNFHILSGIPRLIS